MVGQALILAATGGVFPKTWMNPMHPLLFCASPAHSPSQPPGYGTLAGGWEGAWPSQVFKHGMNPMRPSISGGASEQARRDAVRCSNGKSEAIDVSGMDPG